MSKAALNIGVQISVQFPAFSSLGCISRNKIVGSYRNLGFPDGSDGKEFACNVRAPYSIPGPLFESLEKGMATHSSILVWRIPQTEEPGGWQLYV